MKNYIQLFCIIFMTTLVAACHSAGNFCGPDDRSFHDAGDENNVPGMRRIRARKNVNPSAYCNEKGHQPSIMCVALKGYSDVIKYLIDECGVNPNVQPPQYNGLTPLMAASLYGYTASVEALLAGRANPDTQAGNGCTALMMAAKNGRTNALKALLRGGANPDIQDTEGWTALMKAGLNGHTNAVQELLKAEADTDIQSHGDKYTALIFAALAGHTSTVQALVDGDADLDMRSSGGQTALFMAVFKNRKEAVRILAKAGANAHIPNNGTYTPMGMALDNAMESNDFDIIDILVKDGGVDINARV